MTNLCPDEYIMFFLCTHNALKMPSYFAHYAATDLRVTFTKKLKKQLFNILIKRPIKSKNYVHLNYLFI